MRETCPQYLLLDDSNIPGAFDADSTLCHESAAENKRRTLMLSGMPSADGTLSTVGTDHCPFTMEQKKAGINDFRKIPGGAGGVEHRLELLYTHGVINQSVNI